MKKIVNVHIHTFRTLCVCEMESKGACKRCSFGRLRLEKTLERCHFYQVAIEYILAHTL